MKRILVLAIAIFLPVLVFIQGGEVARGSDGLLSPDEARTLASFREVEAPLYTMTKL